MQQSPQLLNPVLQKDGLGSFINAPWLERIFCLVSWWDVEKFGAEHFYIIASALQAMVDNLERRRELSADEVVKENEAKGLLEELRIIRDHCEKIGLYVAADTGEDLSRELGDFSFQWATGEVAKRLTELTRVIQREMKRTLFLHIPTEYAKWYQTPLEGWETVTDRFGGRVIGDIEEASKCFACDRYAAAVFHIMRVAEAGVLAVGECVNINDPKPSWHSVIGRLRNITQERKYPDLSPDEKKYFRVLEQVFPLMLGMQKAWRDKVTHVANRLILETGEIQSYVAEDIIIASRAFMRTLALELNEVEKA